MALFAKSKGGPQEKKTLTELLKFIASETTKPNGVGHALAPKNLVDKIQKLEPGLVEIKGTVDPGGNIPVSATIKGVEASGGTVPAANESAASESDDSTSEFVLESGFAPPPINRGGLKGSVYPFDRMSVGHSFFVAATTDNAEPAKGLASTVSSANRRYAAVYPATVGKDKTPHAKAGQSTGKDGRKFTVRARTVADGEKSNGARVYRIA